MMWLHIAPMVHDPQRGNRYHKDGRSPDGVRDVVVKDNPEYNVRYPGQMSDVKYIWR